MRILAISSELVGHVTGIHGLLRHSRSYGHDCYYMFMRPPSERVLQILGGERVLAPPEPSLGPVSGETPSVSSHAEGAAGGHRRPDFAAIYRDREALRRLAFGASDAMPRTVRKIEEILVSYRIDLLVTDGVIVSAVLAAHWAGIPYATIPAGFAPFFTHRTGPEFDVARELKPFRERTFFRYGVPAHQWVQNYVASEYANVILSTREFVGDGPPRLTFKYRLVGPLLLEADVGAPAKPIPDSLPRESFVFVSFGTLATGPLCLMIARHVVAACRRLGVPCVIARGNLPKTDGLNALVYDYFVPQDAFLARSAVFVNAAGMNSLSQAMLAGVPSLAFPMFFDQYDSAWLLRQCGAGDFLEPDRVTSRQVREALERLLSDERYRVRARAIGSSYRSASGVEAAFAYLERGGVQ